MARWYIIHAYSGFENKVRDAIISEAERLGLSEGVEEVEGHGVRVALALGVRVGERREHARLPAHHVVRRDGLVEELEHADLCVENVASTARV